MNPFGKFLIENAPSSRFFLEGEDGKREITLSCINLSGVISSNDPESIETVTRKGYGVLNSGDGDYLLRISRRR